jgi:hypothetical protein
VLRHIETPPDPLAWSERIESWPRRYARGKPEIWRATTLRRPGRGRQREAQAPRVNGGGHVSRRAAPPSSPLGELAASRRSNERSGAAPAVRPRAAGARGSFNTGATLRGLPEAVPLRRRPDRRSASGDVEGMRDASRLTLRHYASLLSVSNASFAFLRHACTMFGSAW